MRKEIPDILSQLTRENHKDINAESFKGISIKNNKDTNELSNKNTKTYKHKATKKVRVTFSMSADIVDDLEKCWVKMRLLKKSKGVSRSDIVELSLKEMIQDFINEKEESKLFKNI